MSDSLNEQFTDVNVAIPIKKVTVGGVTYDIEDTYSREQLDNKQKSISQSSSEPSSSEVGDLWIDLSEASGIPEIVDPEPTSGSAHLVTSGGVYDAIEEAKQGASAQWGKITGTLSNQTDLQTALNAKQNTLTAGYGISIVGNTISVNLPSAHGVEF